MFSQVSVCPQGCVWQTPSGQTHPGQTLPLGRHPLPGQRHPPPGDTPPGQCMLGYSQQADGTHPTGMHSCYRPQTKLR